MTRARELADLLTGGQTITTADNTTQLTLESTDADSSVGPVLDLVRDSASPADGDAVGQIKYIADNDAGEATTYSSAFTTLRDASDGAEDGQVINYVITGGSLVDHLRMGRGSANGQSEVIINEGSADIDFRVESDGNTHMLFVDAASELVTMGTTVGGLFNAEGTTATLTVAGSDTSTTTIGNGGAAINISNKDGTAGNTAGIHFSREDNVGNPHFSGAAIVAQFPDAQADGEYPKGRLHFNTSTTANAAPSTKMTLLEDGNLGIGTTSPTQPLSISTSGSNGLFLLRDEGTATNSCRLYFDSSNTRYAIFANDGTLSFCSGGTPGSSTGTERVAFTVNGINSSAVAANGTVSAANLFISGGNNFQKSSSSSRYKTDITDSIRGLSDVMKMRSVTYKGINDGDRFFGGLIAEEVHDAGLIEYVDYRQDDDGNDIPEGVHYGHMVALAFKAIQELKAELDAEKVKTAALQTQVADLITRVTALEGA